MVSVIFGRRGCGKSTLMRSRIATIPRILVFDTLGEYSDLGIVVRDRLTLIDTVELKQSGLFRIVFAPIDEEPQAAFDTFLQTAWICGNVYLAIDEVEQFASPISLGLSFRRNLSYGRHRGLSLLTASRRAAEVPRLLTSQADEIISFNQTEPRDIQYLASFCGSDFAESTMKLQRFSCLQFQPFDPDALPGPYSNRAVPFAR
jgi:hypothetical protein